MKYAKLSSLGGELIKADEADYEHYKGFLKCPVCDDLVFLRKSHRRGKRFVNSAFIHHKASIEASICEQRVKTYRTQQIQEIASKARGQRLAKLRVSMWKYLKTNLTVDLKYWDKDKKTVEKNEGLAEAVRLTHELVDVNKNEFLEAIFQEIVDKFFDEETIMARAIEDHTHFSKFKIKWKSRWKLHCKISKEMLDVFLNNSEFQEIRHRVLCCLCQPGFVNEMAVPAGVEVGSDAWCTHLASYILISICFLFITVQWIEIFDQ